MRGPLLTNETRLNSASFEPRSEERAALIRKSWAEAKTLIDGDGNYNELFFQQSFATQSLA